VWNELPPVFQLASRRKAGRGPQHQPCVATVEPGSIGEELGFQSRRTWAARITRCRLEGFLIDLCGFSSAMKELWCSRWRIQRQQPSAGEIRKGDAYDGLGPGLPPKRLLGWLAPMQTNHLPLLHRPATRRGKNAAVCYVKDDDYRSGFLYGFLSHAHQSSIAADWPAHREQRLSRCFVSVHAHEPCGCAGRLAGQSPAGLLLRPVGLVVRTGACRSIAQVGGLAAALNDGEAFCCDSLRIWPAFAAEALARCSRGGGAGGADPFSARSGISLVCPSTGLARAVIELVEPFQQGVPGAAGQPFSPGSPMSGYLIAGLSPLPPRSAPTKTCPSSEKRCLGAPSAAFSSMPSIRPPARLPERLAPLRGEVSWVVGQLGAGALSPVAGSGSLPSDGLELGSCMA